jgi:hypothetical protein
MSASYEQLQDLIKSPIISLMGSKTTIPNTPQINTQLEGIVVLLLLLFSGHEVSMRRLK